MFFGIRISGLFRNSDFGFRIFEAIRRVHLKITLAPSSHHSRDPGESQYLTSFVINGNVAVDAGSLGFFGEPAEQALVEHVFVSHSHIDHLASFPIFLENIFDLSVVPVTLHASAVTHESVRLDLFNNRLWPDFLKLKVNNRPFVQVAHIEHGQTVEVCGLRLSAISVDHVVPTLGFIIEDGKSAVVIASDTGPTEAIWAKAKQTPNLKAVFLEATFPDDLAGLAKISAHLIPSTFAKEMDKLPADVMFYAVHLKARFRDKVTQELQALQRANLRIAEFGKVYLF